MERLKRIFNREFSKISEAALVLAFFTLLSQLLGIVRDRLLAGNIGVGVELDMYYAAFRVPDFLFTLGASLVSVSILLPYFGKALSRGGGEAKSFINDIFTSFFLFITIAALACFIAMPFFVTKLFPAFEPEVVDGVVKLSRIMLLSPILLGISNLFASITQSFKNFFVYALSPIFYNLGIILGVLVFFPFFGVVGLAFGVALGAFLHMAIQLPVVVRKGFLPRFSRSIRWDNLRSVLIHSFPRTLTLSLSKLLFLFFVSIASGLGEGIISVFNLSYNLQSVPLAIIGVSYSVAAFPILVEHFNAENFEEFMSHVMGPIRQIVFWSLPIISLFIVLRAQIVRTILGTGNFDWSDTRLTAASLALFIISVVAQSIILLLVRAYYAAGKTWRPLLIMLSSAFMTVFFAYGLLYAFREYPLVQGFFELLLRISDVPGSSVIMLSLSYSLGMFFNLILLWVAFRRDFHFAIRKSYGIKRSLIQSAGASVLMGLSIYATLNVTADFFRQDTALSVFGHGFLAGIVGIIVVVSFLLAIKNEDFLLMWRSLVRKIEKIKKKKA